MKKNSIVIVFLFVMLFIVFAILQPLQTINGLGSGFFVSEQDIEIANKENAFGGFIETTLEEQQVSVSGQAMKEKVVVFKLFGIIPVKKIVVREDDGSEYFVGGVPVGISIDSQGVFVVSNEDNNAKSLKEGDLIVEVDGNKVNCLEEVSNMLQQVDSDEVELKYVRKNKEIRTLAKIIKNKETGKNMLGLWGKDEVSGVGTLTFVNKDTLAFGALGHPIVETAGGNIVPVSDGRIFDCNLIGINKGKKNDPGELKCVFVPTKSAKGEIESNGKFGIKGTLTDVSSLIDPNKTARLGGRLGVKMGDARIVSSVSGIREEYDIEIIKIHYQKEADDKSIVFRVKDKRLLQLTGGIVQGMSGSPILQDGKIVGAVTHVFVSDPTKGYGVYVDFML